MSAVDVFYPLTPSFTNPYRPSFSMQPRANSQQRGPTKHTCAVSRPRSRATAQPQHAGHMPRCSLQPF